MLKFGNGVLWLGKAMLRFSEGLVRFCERLQGFGYGRSLFRFG